MTAAVWSGADPFGVGARAADRMRHRDALAGLGRLAAPAAPVVAATLRAPYAGPPLAAAPAAPVPAAGPAPALPSGVAAPPAASGALPEPPPPAAPASLAEGGLNPGATPPTDLVPAPLAPSPAPPAPATAEVEVGHAPPALDGGPVVEVIWLGEGPPPDLLPFVEAPPTARVVMSEPGPVRRRDPIEPPLLEQGEWNEWLLSVVLNGQLVSDGALFIRNRDEEWAVQVLDLRVWRVRLDDDRIITFNGEAFYPLAALPGLEQRYDAATLTIALDLPPDAFEPSTLEAKRPTNLAAVAGRGGFLDYDFLFLTGDGLRTRLDALFELGLFDQIGVLISGFRAGDVANAEREFVRLDTTFTRDLPARRASLRVGDSLTEGGALGRPVRFGGLQWSSDFSTDPTFVTFPLPTIGGLASQPSVAEVFLNNSRRVTEEVPPGPFAIEDLPALTGAGELQLKVTDLLGRETVVTQSYYVSSRLLRAGLSEYSYELGFERDKFNEASFDYGKPLAAATHRYGITDGLTGEGHVELAEPQQALGAGGSVLLGTLGLLSGGVVGSRHGSEPGFAAFADYEYRADRFDVGLRSRYSSSGFRQLGLDERPARRVDQASFGLNVYPFGRVGMLLVNADTREGPNRLSAAANYSVPIGPGSFLVNAVRTLDPDQEFAITATYAISLTPVDSMSSTVGWQEQGLRSRSQYSRGRGASDIGPSYRLASETGHNARLVDATVRYDATMASGQVEATYQEGQKAMRASLDGALAYVDGHAGLTRQLGRAFGIVDLPGYSDVTVYVENREVGRTDADGQLFLPRLNPYQENHVRIRAEDLPLTAQIDVEEKIAVPFDRSGVGVTFDIEDNRTALATLLDAKGAPLPAGLELVGAEGAVRAQVADQGFAYITGSGDAAAALQSVPGQPAFRCDLPALPEEPMAQLGEIRCE
jgi:outer membrane usher protein